MTPRPRLKTSIAGIVASVALAVPVYAQINATGSDSANAWNNVDATFFVRPNGRDNGPGSRADPYRSIKSTLNKVRPRVKNGEVIRVILLNDGGEFTESFSWFGSGDETQGRLILGGEASNKKAVITGARRPGANDWRNDGNNTWSLPNTNLPRATDSNANVPPSELKSKELVRINGALLSQVGNRNALFNNSFFQDRGANRTFVKRSGWNRQGAEVIRSAGRVVSLGSLRNALIQNIIVRMGAAEGSVSEGSFLVSLSTNVLIRNCEAYHNGSAGFQLRDVRRSTIANSRFVQNGTLGATFFLLRNCVFLNTNFNDNARKAKWAGVFNNWNVAGMKMGQFSDIVRFEGVEGSRNAAHGLWCDVGCRNITLRDCKTNSNRSFRPSSQGGGDARGVFLELSQGPFLYVGSRSQNNDEGLCISNAAGVTVNRCRITGNGFSQIKLIAKDRGGDFPFTFARMAVRNSTLRGVGNGRDGSILFRRGTSELGRYRTGLEDAELSNNTYLHPSGNAALFSGLNGNGTAFARVSFGAWKNQVQFDTSDPPRRP